MRVLIAPDSLGGWLSATEFCSRVQAGLSDIPGLDLVFHPVADGGEGSLEVLSHHLGSSRQDHRFFCAQGGQRCVQSLALGESLFLESALAIGLPSGHGSGDPMRGSSGALGDWVRLAQPSPLVIGLGGSSTVDGGIGLLRALGLEILDDRGEAVPAGAAGLLRLDRVQGKTTAIGQIEAWCDVQTTLEECVHRYGPQKGLEEARLEPVRAGMLRWGRMLSDWSERCGRAPLPLDLAGGGAAGGLGFALAALGAELRPGFEAIGSATSLRVKMEEVDWVVCAEGQLDRGSFEGKPVGEIIRWAREAGCQVLALVGRALDTPQAPIGPDQIIEIGREPNPDEALRKALCRLSASIGWELRTEKY